MKEKIKNAAYHAAKTMFGIVVNTAFIVVIGVTVVSVIGEDVNKSSLLVIGSAAVVVVSTIIKQIKLANAIRQNKDQVAEFNTKLAQSDELCRGVETHAQADKLVLEYRVRGLQDILENLLGHVPQAPARSDSKDPEDDHFQTFLTLVKERVNALRRVQNLAVRLTTFKEEDVRRQANGPMDPKVFEKVLRLLQYYNMMLASVGPALGVGGPPLLSDDEKRHEAFRARLQEVVQRINLTTVARLEREVAELHQNEAESMCGLACALYLLRPEKRVEEMSETELRAVLLDLVKELKQMRLNAARFLVEALGKPGVSLETILATAEKKEVSRLTVRAAISEAVDEALNSRKLIGTDQAADHPQMRELVHLCLVQPPPDSTNQATSA
ncbi:TPA: hypothetical protein DEA21_05600 [Candidatus Uhrbacteria bacterium]|nr:hypothetical protein [Candidatus Uhrbacteria bacterium]